MDSLLSMRPVVTVANSSFASKVRGLIVLERVLSGRKLDFVVLYLRFPPF
jgi:hypothetical protein